MRYVILAAMLLTACGKDIHKDMVAPNQVGQAEQRSKLDPSEQLAFDRYLMLNDVPYAISTKGDSVEDAVRYGKYTLGTDATGETKTPATQRAEAASKDAEYQAAADLVRSNCVGFEPKYRKMCIDNGQRILRENGVPERFMPM